MIDARRAIGDWLDAGVKDSEILILSPSITRFLRAAWRGPASDEEGRLLGSLPLEVRLALEMATHEDAER